MSQNNLELARNGEQVWLNYWDAMHGEDQIIELHEDGQALLCFLDWHKDEEAKQPINLVEFLRSLAKKIRE